MTQAERRLYLIRSLLNEKTEYQSLNVPRDAGEQRKLLRSLMNVRMPKVADEAFLRVQDEYLQQELADEGITDLDDLRPVSGDLYLWQGDITRLKCGAIVNAANSGMTGCYIPCHACIDKSTRTVETVHDDTIISGRSIIQRLINFATVAEDFIDFSILHTGSPFQ